MREIRALAAAWRAEATEHRRRVASSLVADVLCLCAARLDAALDARADATLAAADADLEAAGQILADLRLGRAA